MLPHIYPHSRQLVNLSIIPIAPSTPSWYSDFFFFNAAALVCVAAGTPGFHPHVIPSSSPSPLYHRPRLQRLNAVLRAVLRPYPKTICTAPSTPQPPNFFTCGGSAAARAQVQHIFEWMCPPPRLLRYHLTTLPAHSLTTGFAIAHRYRYQRRRHRRRRRSRGRQWLIHGVSKP